MKIYSKCQYKFPYTSEQRTLHIFRFLYFSFGYNFFYSSTSSFAAADSSAWLLKALLRLYSLVALSVLFCMLSAYCAVCALCQWFECFSHIRHCVALQFLTWAFSHFLLGLGNVICVSQFESPTTINRSVENIIGILLLLFFFYSSLFSRCWCCCYCYWVHILLYRVGFEISTQFSFHVSKRKKLSDPSIQNIWYNCQFKTTIPKSTSYFIDREKREQATQQEREREKHREHVGLRVL